MPCLWSWGSVSQTTATLASPFSKTAWGGRAGGWAGGQGDSNTACGCSKAQVAKLSVQIILQQQGEKGPKRGKPWVGWCGERSLVQLSGWACFVEDISEI